MTRKLSDLPSSQRNFRIVAALVLIGAAVIGSIALMVSGQFAVPQAVIALAIVIIALHFLGVDSSEMPNPEDEEIRADGLNSMERGYVDNPFYRGQGGNFYSEDHSNKP